MASSPNEQSQMLLETINSTTSLINQFVASHGQSEGNNLTSAQSAKPPDYRPNPLNVLRDSASLLKAYVTKVSLLAINKPFTPSAVTKVVKELAGTCLPAMMSAVQICQQERDTWGTFMGKEVQARVLRVFREIEVLLGEVQSVAQGNLGVARRDSLSSTGVVWESCDALIELEKMSVAGLMVYKAEQYCDTIKDAIKELQEWTEGDDADNEGQVDQLLDSDDEGVEGDRDSIEDLFNAANSMPADRPELRRLVEEANEKLKKVVLLYNALIKRRLRPFKIALGEPSGFQSSAVYLDGIMLHLKRLPHMVDEIASNFYDLDGELAKATIRKVVDEAVACSLAAEADHNGKEDAFSSWAKKWREVIKTTPSISKGAQNANNATTAKPNRAAPLNAVFTPAAALAVDVCTTALEVPVALLLPLALAAEAAVAVAVAVAIEVPNAVPAVEPDAFAAPEPDVAELELPPDPAQTAERLGGALG